MKLQQKTSNLDNTFNGNSEEAYQATQFLLRRIAPKWIYYKLRTINRRYPFLFFPFARYRWERWRKKYCPDTSGAEPAAPQPLNSNTEIVIEAYPRSGNTFAYTAFKFAQNKPINIGHHTHAAAQVIESAKKRIPTLVIIRNPEDAIISSLIGEFDPGITMKQALLEFIDFYGAILPYKEYIFIAQFQDVISDFGKVIQALNIKYRTQFDIFDHTPENTQKCFELIDAGFSKVFGELNEYVVSRPVETRKDLKEQMKADFNRPELKKLRQRATSIFNELT